MNDSEKPKCVSRRNLFVFRHTEFPGYMVTNLQGFLSVKFFFCVFVIMVTLGRYQREQETHGYLATGTRNEC